MEADVSNELLNEVKNFLDITWDDPAGDIKLSGIIQRGIIRINELCNAEFDYSLNTQDALAKDLLLNYVLYARSNAVSDFMDNYSSEINRLQLMQEVKRYGQEEE